VGIAVNTERDRRRLAIIGVREGNVEQAMWNVWTVAIELSCGMIMLARVVYVARLES
jgi:hypothetical protein